MTAAGRSPARTGALPLAPGLYPARVWPANILRLHLVFSRPVDTWGAAGAVRLTDARGVDRPGVFVDLPQGLWSACGCILTLLLHPGRVKQGLAAHDRLGPALVPGETVTLVLAPELVAADGGPHGLPDRFPLRIAPPVTTPIPPAALRRTRTGLRLGGQAPIDALGALVHVRLCAADGSLLPARLSPRPDGALHLVPHDGLPPARRTRVDDALEDCCGNRRAAAFAHAAAVNARPA